MRILGIPKLKSYISNFSQWECDQQKYLTIEGSKRVSKTIANPEKFTRHSNLSQLPTWFMISHVSYWSLFHSSQELWNKVSVYTTVCMVDIFSSLLTGIVSNDNFFIYSSLQIVIYYWLILSTDYMKWNTEI